MNSEGDSNIDEIALKFLNGELDSAQMEKLKEQLPNDPELQEVIHSSRMLLEQIEQEGRTNLLSRLKDIDNAMLPTSNNARRQIIWTVSVAAIILFVLTFQFLLPWSGRSDAELYNTYFQKYPLELSTQSRGDDQPEIQQAYSHYTANEFLMAISIFEHLSLEKDDIGWFYLSICYAEIGNHHKSIEILRSYLEGSDNLINETRWYLALQLIKLGKRIEAIEYLNLIPESHKEFGEKAKRLIDDLS